MDSGTATSLPAALTPLLGRDQDLRHLTRLLHEGARLVTLRGPGGIGKTALALEVARALHPELKGGAHLIELAALHDPAGVLPALAAALALPLQGRAPRDVIITALNATPILLLLDNFEQVRAAALDVHALLTALPDLRVLVTSRVTLGLHDEQEYPLGPLDLPRAHAALTASPAVQLFLDRVRRHDPTFTLTAQDEQNVLRICRTLEGIPLALELAAAATRTLPLADLTLRLDRGVSSLKENYLDRPDRLRSLRATVEWSFDLLPDDLRALFTCCAVFHGGFTTEALQTVWGEDAGELLRDLEAQSLLQRVPGPQARWRLLEPLRELAADKLDAHEHAQTWRQRHAWYYARLFGRLVGQPHEQVELARIERAQGHLERANVTTALDWAARQEDADLAMACLSAMEVFFVTEASSQADLRRARQVLSLSGARDHPRRLRALQVTWEAVINTHEPLGRHVDLLLEWAELARARRDPVHLLWTTLGLAQYHYDRGEAEQGRAYARQVLNGFETAERDASLSAETVRAVELMRGDVMFNLALACTWHGELHEARTYALEALERLTRDGLYPVLGRCYGLLLLANIERQLGHSAVASTLLVEVMTHLEPGRFRALTPEAALLLAQLALDAGHPRHAVRFAVLAQTLDAEVEVLLDRQQSDLTALLGQARASMTPVLFEEARKDGLELTLAEAWRRWKDVERDVVASPKPLRRSEGVLTAREEEVLTLVAQGHPDRRIAKLLGISSATVSKHVGSLLAKLELRNRVELTRWALEHPAENTSPPQS